MVAAAANAIPGRDGYEMVVVLGGDKPATRLFVPGVAIGDLQDTRYIDDFDKSRAEGMCVTLTGVPVAMPDGLLLLLQGECGLSRKETLVRSRLSYAAAINALRDVDGMSDCVTDAEEEWVSDERMDPVLSALSQLFVGGYRSLTAATRVQEAVRSGRVTGEAVALALQEIAAKHPRS
jgi:hypothetical protein